MQVLKTLPGWGNARDTIALWKSVKNHRANRVVSNPETIKTVAVSDVRNAFSEMMEARRPKVSEEELALEKLMEAAQGFGKCQLDEPRSESKVTIDKFTILKLIG